MSITAKPEHVRAETVTPSPAVGSRKEPVSRSERRRRARRRRAALVAAVVAAALVLAGGGVALWWALSGNDGRTGARQAGGAAGTAVPAPLLLELVGDDGRGLGAALLQQDSHDGRSGLVLIPTHLIVDVPGVGSQQLADAVSLPDADGAAKAVSDLLDLRVDGAWVLRQGGLVALVDSVGGVTVDVDREVLRTQPDGSRVVIVPQGSQHLDGALAAAYATWLAPDEPEQARVARLKKVLQALVERLPEGRDGIASTLQRLGAGSRTAGVDRATLATVLAALRTDARADQLDYDVLTTRVLETGGSQEALTLDEDASAATLARLFPRALRTAGGAAPPKVLVENGVGTPGLGRSARDRLVAAGLRFVAGGNAPELGAARTVVVVKDASPPSRQLGARVARALGVGTDALRIAAREQSVADVVVILGADFRP